MKTKPSKALQEIRRRNPGVYLPTGAELAAKLQTLVKPKPVHLPHGKTDLEDTIERLTKERDEAQAKLRESEAKCAEMREVLAFVGTGWKYPFEHFNQRIEHALSSDCGKGWKSPEEYASLEAKCAVKDKALRIFIAAEEDWRKHGLPMDTEDLLSDAYQEALKALPEHIAD